MRTRLTDLLEIEHPVMLAGMGGVSYSRLVAAVSEAGGFGCLGASTMSPDQMEDEMRAVREATGAHALEVAAVGLCGQMHGVVLSGDAGEPLRPAILWADGRARPQLEAYNHLSGERRRQLANPPATGMAGPTLLWLRDNERDVYRRAHWALQPKDWLRLRLIHEAATEPSDASATLAIAGVPPRICLW